METHAHHLHKAPGKKFSHYFFEFLMLFFAVFAGFLAENWREHIAEHQRAREYAKALAEDLAADTTEILDVIREDQIVLTCFDSVKAVAHERHAGNMVPGSFTIIAILELLHQPSSGQMLPLPRSPSLEIFDILRTWI